MPELPEVETVCRLMRRVLVGHKIVTAEVAEDSIVLSGLPPEAVRARLEGSEVRSVGRKGKYWWLAFDSGPCLGGHLGMSGWIRQLGEPSKRLLAHGNAAMDDEEERPRFLKLLMETDAGDRVAFTDGRRLGRLWLFDDPKTERVISALGPDVFDSPPTQEALSKTLGKRKTPIKALLLDQSLFAGVGNWVADEVLYHAGISPKRLGSELTPEQVQSLRDALSTVLTVAVEAEAEAERYPPSWLFHHRWGGARGADIIEGAEIVREPIGGRTTAWVPSRQA